MQTSVVGIIINSIVLYNQSNISQAINMVYGHIDFPRRIHQ